MIITATPFRISFFGGGTDYPVWFRQHGGAVLSTTINRYCYLSCRYLPPFFDFKHRVVWSHIELVDECKDIQHPAVREALQFLGVREGLEVVHTGDLPARAGLGSSSSFAVGILHALHALKGEMVTRQQLAEEAIHLEQDLIGDVVGVQDQIAAAFGGLNRIEFRTDGGFRVDPVPIGASRRDDLERHMLLVYTGVSRHASSVARKKVANIPPKEAVLREMRQMVDEGARLLSGEADLAEFGALLHESWRLKRSISDAISTALVDELYDTARGAGALGGKLLGAGGGGFLLLFARPDRHGAILTALNGFLQVPVALENEGSHVVHYEPDGYARGTRAPSRQVTPVVVPKRLGGHG